jgi:hypothetical protein
MYERSYQLVDLVFGKTATEDLEHGHGLGEVHLTVVVAVEHRHALLPKYVLNFCNRYKHTYTQHA